MFVHVLFLRTFMPARYDLFGSAATYRWPAVSLPAPAQVRAFAFVCRIQWQLQQRKRIGSHRRAGPLPASLWKLACSAAFLKRAGAPRAFEAAKRRMNPTASASMRPPNSKHNTTSLHRWATTNSGTPPAAYGGRPAARQKRGPARP